MVVRGDDLVLVGRFQVEVDNGTESADVLAARFDRYRRFFRLKTRDHLGRDIPMWRTLCRARSTLASNSAPA
ncbi:replication-relaxation family protein [Streptomyces shenzhenensis]|uniref:replication-relaxation family protein n=1 Tax=Streptomyces shenzhenensis TaxID=943815 RepID=UPI003673B3B3